MNPKDNAPIKPKRTNTFSTYSPTKKIAPKNIKIGTRMPIKKIVKKIDNSNLVKNSPIDQDKNCITKIFLLLKK